MCRDGMAVKAKTHMELNNPPRNSTNQQSTGRNNQQCKQTSSFGSESHGHHLRQSKIIIRQSTWVIKTNNQVLLDMKNNSSDQMTIV